MTEFQVTLVIQGIGLVFVAGIFYARMNGVEERIKRVENWINATRNEHGDKLMRG